MIDLVATDSGTILPVRAQPGARRNGIVGEHAGALRIAVTAAPEKGKANEAIAGVLAEALAVRPSAVSIVSGEASRSKRFRIEGEGVGPVGDRLAAILAVL